MSVCTQVCSTRMWMHGWTRGEHLLFSLLLSAKKKKKKRRSDTDPSPRITCLHPPILGLQKCTGKPGFWNGRWGLELRFSCLQMFFLTELPPPVLYYIFLSWISAYSKRLYDSSHNSLKNMNMT